MNRVHRKNTERVRMFLNNIDRTFLDFISSVVLDKFYFSKFIKAFLAIKSRAEKNEIAKASKGY